MSGPERITGPLVDVLEALLSADGYELHGWAIMKSTKRSGPTIYKILERLEKAEWVTAAWEELPPETNKPRRRFYKLTGQGAAEARAVLIKRERQASTTRPVLGGA